MKKVTIKNWINREFERGSEPDERTVRRWCSTGVLPAVQIGKTWYIYQDLADTSTGNDLADKVLRA